MPEVESQPTLNAQPAAHGARPEPGHRRWLRRLVHLLVILAGWALFFWGWQRVLARGADFGELRALVIGAAVVVPVVTISWILHNRGIHRRKGPRRRVADAVLDYRIDFNGREVVADFRALAQARRIEVVIEGASKRYREALLPQADMQAPASGLPSQARSAIDQASHTSLGVGSSAPTTHGAMIRR